MTIRQTLTKLTTKNATPRMTKSADLQRLASLSDCVFAVAMTLLAFSVRVPDQGVDPGSPQGTHPNVE